MGKTKTQDTITLLPVEQLKPHPKNPRVALRDDVVDAIAADLAERGGMEARHAITVRAVGDGYVTAWSCEGPAPDASVVNTQVDRDRAAQAVVAKGWIDSVGLGRMVLSYPGLPADALSGTPLVRGSICRTFSDCTTAPRHGLRSGCYPLDAYYKALPEAAEVKAIKARAEA